MALYRLRALGIFTGEQFDFSVHATGSISTGDAADVFSGALSALWTDHLDAYYPSSTEITTASAGLLDPITGKQQQRVDTATTLAGIDDAGVALPPQLSVVVSLIATLGLLGGRGRFYLPAPTSTAIDAQQLSSTALTAFGAGVAAMMTQLTTGGLTPVIYHRPGSPLAGTSSTVASYRIDSVVDTQRRRRNKLVGTDVSGTI